MLSDLQLYSVKQLLDFFLKYARFESERERDEMCMC